MSVIWRKVWFDLSSNKVRTLLAVLSIAAGVFAVGAVFGMVDQLLSGMDAAHQAVVPSHILLVLNRRIDQATADRLKKTPGVEDIELLNEVAVRYKLSPTDEWQPARLLGHLVYTFIKLILLLPPGRRLRQRFDPASIVFPMRYGVG